MNTRRPNIVLILADDMGFSDIGCYGGEIATPNLDRLAANGVRMTQFYNTARCSPSRASLLTGLHPHQVGVGILNFDDRPDGYPGNLSDRSVTIAEVLREAGYATYLSGKWHLASDMENPNDAWPTRRGFDRFFGTLEGAGSFYRPRTLHRDERNVEHEAEDPDFFYTTAITDNAVDFLRANDPEQPFFLYLSYTAPHWPLHAPEQEIARYDGRFDAGWDILREQRFERLAHEGIIDERWPLSERDPRVPPWEEAENKAVEARRMQVYAAQVQAMDHGIGQLLDTLTRLGQLEDTLILFLSDNGGCAEELTREFVTSFVPLPSHSRDGQPVVPGNLPSLPAGPETTYQSYGRNWANLSNAPFREYKHWVHEGGIATPLIVHWPAGTNGIAPNAGPGRLCDQPYQLVDVLPTILEVTGTRYPESRQGIEIPPAEGVSMLPALRGQPVPDRPLFWEHEGNAAVRDGRWKLVRKHPGRWELYDLENDRTELADHAEREPARVARMAAVYDQWAERCGVIPRQRVLDLYARRGRGLPPE